MNQNKVKPSNYDEVVNTLQGLRSQMNKPLQTSLTSGRTDVVSMRPNSIFRIDKKERASQRKTEAAGLGRLGQHSSYEEGFPSYSQTDNGESETLNVSGPVRPAEVSRRQKPHRVDSRSSSATALGRKTLRELLSGKKNNQSLSPHRSVESFAGRLPDVDRRNVKHDEDRNLMREASRTNAIEEMTFAYATTPAGKKNNPSINQCSPARLRENKRNSPESPERNSLSRDHESFEKKKPNTNEDADLVYYHHTGQLR